MSKGFDKRLWIVIAIVIILILAGIYYKTKVQLAPSTGNSPPTPDPQPVPGGPPLCGPGSDSACQGKTVNASCVVNGKQGICDGLVGKGNCRCALLSF